MKVALIGANGNFGLKRLRSILPSDDEIVALCDLQLDRALEIYDSPGVVKEVDYRNLLDMDFHIAVISLPDFVKLQVVEDFLRAGKHVLVEKPFAPCVDKVRCLYALARKQGVCLYVGYNLRFFPSLAKLLDLVQQNYFGKMHHVRLYYGHGGVHSLMQSQGSWRLGESTWGGSFIDMGTHLLSLAAHFVSSFDSGTIECQHVVSPQVEDHCVGIFKSSGCIIEFTSSWTTWRSRFAAQVYGTEGFAELEGLVKYVKYGQPGELLRYGLRKLGGAPDVTEILFTLPGAKRTIANTVEVAPFSTDVEYLDQEWRWLTRAIADGTFDMAEQERINILIAEVIERFYHGS